MRIAILLEKESLKVDLMFILNIITGIRENKNDINVSDLGWSADQFSMLRLFLVSHIWRALL